VLLYEDQDQRTHITILVSYVSELRGIPLI
jgi:hypothetical protein